MAKSNRENPVFDSLSPTGKAVRAIDIYRFPDGNTKITFVRNVPKKDAAGEII